MALVQADLAQQRFFAATEELLLELSEQKMTDAHQQRFEKLDAQATQLLGIIREAQRRSDDPSMLARGERLLVASRELLTVLDVLTLNWLPVIQKARATELSSSPATLQQMRQLLRQAIAVWTAAWQEYQQEKSRKPRQITTNGISRQAADKRITARFSQPEMELRAHLNQRLRSDEPNRLAIFRAENQLMDALRQIIEAARRLHKIPRLSDHSDERARRTASITIRR